MCECLPPRLWALLLITITLIAAICLTVYIAKYTTFGVLLPMGWLGLFIVLIMIWADGEIEHQKNIYNIRFRDSEHHGTQRQQPHTSTPPPPPLEVEVEVDEEVQPTLPLPLVSVERQPQTSITTTPTPSMMVESSTLAKCVICIQEFKDGELIEPCGICIHEFHFSCLQTWLNTTPKTTCPVCRQDLSKRKKVYIRGSHTPDKF